MSVDGTDTILKNGTMMYDSSENREPMNNNISEIVMRLLQGKQTDEEMQLFLQWYRRKQENRELFFQLKHLYEYRKDGLKPDEKEIAESWERLCRKHNYRTKQYPEIAKYAGIAAATLLLIVSTVYLILNNSDSVVWKEVRTATRSLPQTILLPDGSTVQMNASSYLRYPEKFDKKSREVYLDGEAFFNITSDKRRSFTVHTDQQTINVVGTSFNVLGYSSDPYTVTTLVTGKINLELFNSKNEQIKEMAMQPNHQLFVDKATGEANLSVVDTGDVTSWLNGIYSFKDTRLIEITGRLEKVFGLTILISDEAYRNDRYNGKFFSDQSIDEIVEILNFKDEFLTRFKNDTLILQTNR